MDKQKIYAIRMKGNVEIDREEIGVVVLDASSVSARKYNELKRKLLKAYPSKKGHHIIMLTEDGRKDQFGGYPAENFVRFESEELK